MLNSLSGWYEWRTENKFDTLFSTIRESTDIYRRSFWRRSNGDIETSIITREAVPPLDTILTDLH